MTAAALRLGVLHYPVTHVASWDAYAAKLDALVTEGVAGGADMLLMAEYAAMETAAIHGTLADPAAELDAVCAHAPEVLRVMQGAARRHRAWLQPGTLPWREGGQVVNRAPLIDPKGHVAWSDKQVMTRFEAESWQVSPGRVPRVLDTPWGRLGVAVCYDVEFPLVVRALVEASAWLVLAPTCTDTAHGFNRVRISARARAVENQCFVAVSPTVGDAPWLHSLDRNVGRAGVYGPADRGFAADGVVAEGDGAGWVFADLDPARLDAVRADGAVRNFRDWRAVEPAVAAAWEDVL